MSHIALKNLSMTVFGESHGTHIGGVITGMPAGYEISLEELEGDMRRRRPGFDSISTARREEDLVEIISGVYENKTTGAPICVLIKNSDTRGRDYKTLADIMRPSHSDYGAYIKYGGHNDVRGGGHFSGRLTAPLVAIGSIAKQILKTYGIYVRAHIHHIADCFDTPLVSAEQEYTGFPAFSKEAGEGMVAVIESAKADGDSVGGAVECGVFGTLKGRGGPLFEGVEGKLSSLIFGIPAVKGIEFGMGFKFGSAYASEANDPFCIKEEEIRTITNHCGGILGGITSGEPIIFRVAFKPTPSIFKTQETVNVKEKKETLLKLEGRHDPCIAVRGVPVVESVTAIGILDLVI